MVLSWWCVYSKGEVLCLPISKWYMGYLYSQDSRPFALDLVITCEGDVWWKPKREMRAESSGNRIILYRYSTNRNTILNKKYNRQEDVRGNNREMEPYTPAELISHRGVPIIINCGSLQASATSAALTLHLRALEPKIDRIWSTRGFGC